MKEDEATAGEQSITDGIHPDWWATAIRGGWVSANEVSAMYYSGRIDLHVVSGFLIFDLEPQDGVRLLAVTTGSLVGIVVRRRGNGSNVAISRSAIGFGEVLDLRSAWSSWVNPQDLEGLDLAPHSGLSIDIQLRSPLGPFGTEIHFPLERDDYQGEPTPAIQRFMFELERRLSGPGPGTGESSAS